MPASRRLHAVTQPSDSRAEVAVEEMRTELARLLHDSVAQTLTTMLMELGELRSEQHGRAGVVRQVDRLERSTRKALSEVRELLGDLRARRVGDRDLVKLVKRGIRAREKGRRAVKFELVVSPGWPERIPGRAATELQRIVAEAIENGIRHGGAKHIGVAFAVTRRARLAQVTVIDDGRGLPAHKAPGSAGLGIVGMRARAHLLGGRVQVSRGPGGQGTLVRVTVPLDSLGQTVRLSSTPGDAQPRRAIS